ncbi:MAG: hypothetical protein V5A44_06885 [Haloarculaceae archaeon]
MSVVPGDVETGRQPPMTIPLRHFLVGLGFLLAGGVVGALDAAGLLSGLTRLAHVHLLVAGWVCVTIMGAMTQFVPVWSNVPLHSRRLATAQLWLVTVGVGGMAAAFGAGSLHWVHAMGGLAVLGFWVFVYGLGRTLLAARPWDVTERHFAFALACFAVVPALGFALAMDYTVAVFAASPLVRGDVLAAHATLAVFGAVLATVTGALYQLATMFTRTDLHGIDRHLRRVEEVGYPVGVLALATGRLLGSAPLARVGGALVLVALGAWTLTTGPAWLADPLADATLFGPVPHLLVFGVIGFVVVGTLYHVVPFVVWVHRYSDRLGFEPVPMVDDLYDPRVATADFAATLAGAAGLVATDVLDRPAAVTALAGALATLGFVLFAANMLLVVREHSPHSFRGILVSRLETGTVASDADGEGSF